MGRPRKQRPPPGPVTAADVIEFIETVCFVPEGKFVGQPLKLQDWQKDILRAIYDNPAGTRRAIVSMGRKNSKTHPVRVSIAGASVRPAGPEPTELGIVLRRSEPGSGGDHLHARNEDGSVKSAADANGANPGNRQDAGLQRARNALSGAVGRGEHGLRPFPQPNHP